MVSISCQSTVANSWINVLVDGAQVYTSVSVPYAAYSAPTPMATGTHTVECDGMTAAGKMGSMSDSVTVQ